MAPQELKYESGDNNYIKSSFRVLKDNTLGRTKVNIFHGCTKGRINFFILNHLFKKESLINIFNLGLLTIYMHPFMNTIFLGLQLT